MLRKDLSKNQARTYAMWVRHCDITLIGLNLIIRHKTEGILEEKIILVHQAARSLVTLHSC